ncbi:MAG: cytochrome c oxidase subunit 4 [Polaribacter sp.]|jgi:cytochrome c oxidase subunit 4
MADHSDTEQNLGIVPKDAAYEKASRAVYKGMLLLAVVTLLEVAVSLFGKGHLGFDPEGMGVILAIVGVALVVLSLYKAYFIVYEFMHMGHEVKSLRLTVLMPMLLLVWAIIAFFSEGNYWKNSRGSVNAKNAIELPTTANTPALKKDTKAVMKEDQGQY